MHVLSINIKNINFVSNENFQFDNLKKNLFITCFRNVTHIGFMVLTKKTLKCFLE